MADWFPLILYILGAILAVVLIWAFIELALTLRRTRATVKDLDPVIDKVNSIAESLEPSSKRIDPLFERVSLTVDAVNLEIMRADQILSDVSDVTGTLSGTITKVTDITDAPLNLLSSAAEKVRDIFSGKRPAGSSAVGLATESSGDRDSNQASDDFESVTSTGSPEPARNAEVCVGEQDPIQRQGTQEKPKKDKAPVTTHKISDNGYFNYPQTTATSADNTANAVESKAVVDTMVSGKADPVDFNPDVS
ncbi:MAG: DUF948 domain-containing protein [Coriobacteriaceae bacterium]|nr:DUF948 domain-containing protein [Coriobacteriaceae bacterium]